MNVYWGGSLTITTGPGSHLGPTKVHGADLNELKNKHCKPCEGGVCPLDESLSMRHLDQVRYTTHAIGGLSENDFICAVKINDLLEA